MILIEWENLIVWYTSQQYFDYICFITLYIEHITLYHHHYHKSLFVILFIPMCNMYSITVCLVVCEMELSSRVAMVVSVQHDNPSCNYTQIVPVLTIFYWIQQQHLVTLSRARYSSLKIPDIRMLSFNIKSKIGFIVNQMIRRCRFWYAIFL